MAVPVFNEIGVCGVTLRGASKTNDVNNINIQETIGRSNQMSREI